MRYSPFLGEPSGPSNPLIGPLSQEVHRVLQRLLPAQEVRRRPFQDRAARGGGEGVQGDHVIRQ